MFFALARREGAEIGKKREYGGDRATVRLASALYALDLVRRGIADA